MTELPPHHLVVAPDPDAAAAGAAAEIAALLREAIASKGVATFAVSGGTTAASLFDALADADVAWPAVHVLQVDERVAPDGDPARNLRTLQQHLVEKVAIPARNVHPIDVASLGVDAAARAYADVVMDLGGFLDVVHLGLGDDGHTASLVPADAVLDVDDAAVAPTALYKGHRRITLTYPTLDGARHLVWLATGAAKAPALAKLLDGDASIPAGRVRPSGTSSVHVDAAAAGVEPW